LETPLNPTATTEAGAKARLRAEALARRQSVPAEVREAFGRRLAHEGLRLARTKTASVVSVFHPIRGEPDTLPLLSFLFHSGFVTALPVVVGRAAPLKFRAWSPGDPTMRGWQGLIEPCTEAREVEPDLLFVPLAAFDRRGHRIGFGAGHYDRTLAGLRRRGKLFTVGVAFAVCEIALAPNEPHDEALDCIVTDRETIFP